MIPRVLRIVSQIMEIPIESLSMESSPDAVESWDSLRHMNLILALEEEFGIQFTEEQILEMISVELIVEVLRELAQK